MENMEKCGYTDMGDVITPGRQYKPRTTEKNLRVENYEQVKIY